MRDPWVLGVPNGFVSSGELSDDNGEPLDGAVIKYAGFDVASNPALVCELKDGTIEDGQGARQVVPGTKEPLDQSILKHIFLCQCAALY